MLRCDGCEGYTNDAADSIADEVLGQYACKGRRRRQIVRSDLTFVRRFGLWVVMPCRNVVIVIGEDGVMWVTRGNVVAVITFKSPFDPFAFGRVPGMVLVSVILYSGLSACRGHA